MVKVKTAWKGLAQVRRAADTMTLRVQKASNRVAVGKATTPMLRTAKKLVPYRTGELKRSLTKRVKTMPDGVVTGRIAPRRGTKGVKYAHIVELGSSKMAPRPYMRPAFEQSKDESTAVYKAEIWNDIKREARKAVARAERRRVRR